MDIQIVPISAIDIGEQMIRKTSTEDGLEELALDISRHGLLHPIGVVKTGTGRYQLLYGYRRLMACRSLRWSTIPAVVHDSVDSVKSVALRENIHRAQMSLSEEVDVVAHLHHIEGLSIQSICERLSRSADWVKKRLAIPNFPSDVIEALMDERIGLGVAEELAKIADDSGRATLLACAIQQGWRTGHARQAVEAYLSSPNTAEAIEAGLSVMSAPCHITEIYIPCDVCGTVVRPIDTVAIRVCASCYRNEIPLLKEFISIQEEHEHVHHESDRSTEPH